MARAIPACFDNPTIASEADAAGVSWRFYAGTIYGDGGLWSSYQADRKIFNGPDWSDDVINPPSQFLTDVGKRRARRHNVDHADFRDVRSSEHRRKIRAELGRELVDAIGASKFWKSTAIFIMWDDWGGWFDPVQPVYEDYDGLGFRVPLLIVSPYAKRGSSRTCSTKRRAYCASSKTTSASRSWQRATRARTIPRTTRQTFDYDSAAASVQENRRSEAVLVLDTPREQSIKAARAGAARRGLATRSRGRSSRCGAGA